MGSFNVKCGLTGVNIEPGDQAYIFFMRESKFNPTRHSIKSMFGTGLFVSNNGPEHFYQLDSMPILTSYEDYGQFKIENADSDNFKLYVEHHKMDIPENHILDAQKLNFFVVHKKAYDFVRNSNNYPQDDNFFFFVEDRDKDYHKICEQFATITSDCDKFLKKLAHSIIETYSHRLSYAYTSLYASKSQNMMQVYLDMHLLTDAMLRTGRFYHCPVYGEQDSNTDFLKNLYQSL
jgi:hypothetical protein